MKMRLRVLVVVLLAAFAGGLTASAQLAFTHSVASGDPRPESVVLWSRIAPETELDGLRVEVATDEGFSDIVQVRDGLETDAMSDWCLKVRVDGLDPATTYYYRFVIVPSGGGSPVVSPTGRTRTAPAPDDPRPVRFAVIYCQDYVGRYYNTLAKLLRDHDEDLDFVVHLGDYVYETTGDPSFQDPTAERGVQFGDPAGAIPLGPQTLAARSLDNYRDLYRIYRSDEMLRQVHERWPMVVIWDDHEFSDDSWGPNGTYFDGFVDEEAVARKQDAERAFFEWIPTEVGLGADGTLAVDASMLYPNTRLQRDLRFGQHLHLVLTDYRTYRPDHLIPEDALPGAIALDQATLEATLGEAWPGARDSFDPYLDLDALGAVLPILRQTATLVVATALTESVPGLELPEAVSMARQQLTGQVSATFLNLLFERAGLPAPFDADVLATLPRGLSYLLLGKTGFFTSTGSRYAVAHDTYQLLAGAQWVATGGAAQDAYGPQQTAWLEGVLTSSDASWRILGSSVMLTPLIVDFTNPAIAGQLPPDFPEDLKIRLDLNVDQFDGFPQKRQELLGLLGLVPNSLVISGDIHSTFVTDHGNGVFELTPPAVSSGTFQDLVGRTIAQDPVLGQVEGLDQLLTQLPTLLQVSAQNDDLTPSDLLYAETTTHGFMVMEVAGAEVTARIYETPSDTTLTSYYEDPAALDGLFSDIGFVVSGGTITPAP